MSSFSLPVAYRTLEMSVAMESADDSLLIFPSNPIRYCLNETSSGWVASNRPRDLVVTLSWALVSLGVCTLNFRVSVVWPTSFSICDGLVFLAFRRSRALSFSETSGCIV